MEKDAAYGLELMIRKNTGRLNGWISYTLSKTETKIPGINENRWYKASNDRRNDLVVVAMYKLNGRWDLSASWSYSSGRPLTAPDQKYEIDGTTCYYYTERNSYKTPASHRLDLSAKYTKVGSALHPYGYSVFIMFIRIIARLLYILKMIPPNRLGRERSNDPCSE